MIHFVKNTLQKALDQLNKWIFNLSIEKKDFCIFSNDCWGGELYRRMKLPYNTPFVGLMLMAPCYLKFLNDPRKYIDANLEFVSGSIYPMINELRKQNGYFPIGRILDIEVHFLHFKSEEEAIEKWNRRKLRINWENLYVKFTLDKDYASDDHLIDFDNLPYLRKVCFSRNSHSDSKSCIKINNFVENGVFMFRACMKEFDIVGWINTGSKKFSGFNRLRGIILFFSLVR